MYLYLCGFWKCNILEQCPELSTIKELSTTPGGNTLTVKWEPDIIESKSCLQIEYLVSYQLTNRDQCLPLSNEPVTNADQVTSSFLTIQGLEYNSNYIVYVTPVLSGKNGTVSTLLSQMTGQSGPTSPPSNVKTYHVSYKKVSFRWSIPPCGSRNGPIVSYFYTFTNNNGMIIKNDETADEYVSFGNLSSSASYTFSVAAATEIGVGPAHTMVITTMEKPEAPMVRVVDVSKTSIHISWTDPEYTNSMIKYSVQGKIIDKPYDPVFAPAVAFEFHDEVNSLQRTFEIQNLQPSTKYEIQVAAHTDVGRSVPAIITQSTDPVTEEDISTSSRLQEISRSQLSTSTVEIEIPQSSSEFVSGYLVGVELEITKKNDTISFEQKIDSVYGHYAYVAAEIPKADVMMDSIFIVGDDRMYGEYSNEPLHEGYTYMLYIAVYSYINSTTKVVSWSMGTNVALPVSDPTSGSKTNLSTGSGANTTMIAVFACLLVLMLIVIAIMAYKIRSLANANTALQNSKTTSTSLSKKGVNIAGPSGQIQVSSDGYVEYKVEQDENSTYQGIGKTADDTQPSNAAGNAVYVNDSVIGVNKRNNSDEYEYVKSNWKISLSNTYISDHLRHVYILLHINGLIFYSPLQLKQFHG
ncbi:uncharacterized protein [Amphiura filiformis]|uniref:uncharacterized protein n=1 Tax=Amphiura filiformis TaxID=82378 RepID=UPI003B21EFCA